MMFLYYIYIYLFMSYLLHLRDTSLPCLVPFRSEDWSLEDLRNSASKGRFRVSKAIFVECFEALFSKTCWSIYVKRVQK